jgi:hypothetical protein
MQSLSARPSFPQSADQLSTKHAQTQTLQTCPRCRRLRIRDCCCQQKWDHSPYRRPLRSPMHKHKWLQNNRLFFRKYYSFSEYFIFPLFIENELSRNRFEIRLAIRTFSSISDLGFSKNDANFRKKQTFWVPVQLMMYCRVFQEFDEIVARKNSIHRFVGHYFDNSSKFIPQTTWPTQWLDVIRVNRSNWWCFVDYFDSLSKLLPEATWLTQLFDCIE